MGAVLREICIDCIDSARVAEFWSKVLGWKVQTQDGYHWMSESGEPCRLRRVLSRYMRLSAVASSVS